MRTESQPGERKGQGNGLIGAGSAPVVSKSAGSDLDRRYRVALVLYVVLAALAWFTLGEGKVLVGGKLVEVRLLPLVILGGFALRTVLARQAEKIRRGGDGGGSSTP
jgi:hypothetical protein